MKEEFRTSNYSAVDQRLITGLVTIGDDGVSYEIIDEKAKKPIKIVFPYGSIKKMRIIGFPSQLDIKGNPHAVAVIINKADKSRIKQALAFAEERNLKAASCESVKTYLEPNEIESPEIESPKEYRWRCKVCGNVFCYSDEDLLRNKQLAKDAFKESGMAFLSALGTSVIQSNQNMARADQLMARIIDYSKCPKCNSTDLVELSEEDFQDINFAEKNEKASTVSSADEIKKFKELLDLGIITQEEFDAKKKQLLGL